MFFFTRPVTPEDKQDHVVDNVKENHAVILPPNDIPTPPVTPGLDRPGIRGLLTQLQENVFDKFKSLCEEQSLLEKPVGLGANDSLDGINDETSLL